jgi:hypothetical protein
MNKDKLVLISGVFAIAIDNETLIDGAFALTEYLLINHPELKPKDRQRLFVLMVDFQEAMQKYESAK